MAVAEAAYTTQCEKTTHKLAATYGWPSEVVAGLAHAASGRLAAGSDRGRPDTKTIERACLTEYFARLYDKLASGPGRERDDAARQLFDTAPVDGDSVDAVARGYLNKAALRLVGSWRRKYALKLTEEQTREIAMDSASSALASIVTKISSCRGRDLFWGWATRIVENAVVDEMRKLRNERAADGEKHAIAPDPAEKIVNDVAVAHEFIRKCRIGELSHEQRVTLYKSFWQDASVQEIADTIAQQSGKAVTHGNVAVWKTRGLKIMAKNLHSVGFR